MKTSKKIGLALIMVFSLSSLWGMIILSYAFLTNHKLFRFEFVVSMLSNIAWVITVVWGSIAGVGMVKKFKKPVASIPQNISGVKE